MQHCGNYVCAERAPDNRLNLKVRKQYKRDMPMNTPDVRFSPKRTFAPSRVMTGVQQRTCMFCYRTSTIWQKLSVIALRLCDYPW